MIYLLLLIAILVAIFLIKKSKSSSSEQLINIPLKLSYKKKEFLLSKAERSFYEVLCLAVKNSNVRIFVKVRLADLLYLPKGVESRQVHVNRITSKHVDFVICSSPGLSPVIAIELDDSSHQQPNRVTRDEFLDQALGDAGLPLLRIPAKESYNVQELTAKIDNIMSARDQVASTKTK